MFQITKDKDGNDSLVCRRPNECDADRVHACGIEYIKETDKLLKFVNCSLVEGFKTQHVPIEKVLKCIHLINTTNYSYFIKISLS